MMFFDKDKMKKEFDNAYITVRKYLIYEIMQLTDKKARRGLIDLACMMNNADLNEAILIHKGGLK